MQFVFVVITSEIGLINYGMPIAVDYCRENAALLRKWVQGLDLLILSFCDVLCSSESAFCVAGIFFIEFTVRVLKRKFRTRYKLSIT